MIKQDFISKYIQELNKTLARIISLEIGNADEGFLIIFNQMLQSYYKIDDNNLSTLLQANEERDQFLLADELKKKNILTFMKAIRIYLYREDVAKAKDILGRTATLEIRMVDDSPAAASASPPSARTRASSIRTRTRPRTSLSRS